MNSRRRFITQLKDTVLDNIPAPKLPVKIRNSWISLGRISDFQPESEISIQNLSVTVVSRPEGIQVRDFSGIHRPIRIQSSGVLEFDPNGQWPGNSLLSIMTQEQLFLDREMKT